MNKKGVIFGAYVVGALKISFVAVAAACIWHIPAWTKAKADHKEAEYQAQAMWPQQEFAKLPGGSGYVPVVTVPGNGGNFPGGISHE